MSVFMVVPIRDERRDIMAKQTLQRADFKETYAVHAALRSGLKGKLFSKDLAAQKAAKRLLGYLESDKSIYGRQCKMIKLMQKGATIAQLRKGLKCSRRTVFRYFHDLDDAGIEVALDGTVYSVSKGLLKLIG
jgi:Helix-turn-helix domain of resolvase